MRCQSLKLEFTDLKLGFTVIPAQAGIQIAALVSRLRGNDVTQRLRFDKALAPGAKSKMSLNQQIANSKF